MPSRLRLGPLRTNRMSGIAQWPGGTDYRFIGTSPGKWKHSRRRASRLRSCPEDLPHFASLMRITISALGLAATCGVHLLLQRIVAEGTDQYVGADHVARGAVERK